VKIVRERAFILLAYEARAMIQMIPYYIITNNLILVILNTKVISYISKHNFSSF
jgi:hypothetical protein